MLSESYKKRIKELAGILSEEVDNATAFDASSSRVSFDIDLMTQAIQEGREVGILYRGDDMRAPSGKYRLIYPVAMGISTAGNRVVRAIHKVGQSESEANRTGVRSAEAKNVWRLFKIQNIKGMWMTGNFFRGPLSGYNPNDNGMSNVEVYADLSKIKSFQDELLRKQKEEQSQESKVKRFIDKGEREIQQPISNPDTRIGTNDVEPPVPELEDNLEFEDNLEAEQ